MTDTANRPARARKSFDRSTASLRVAFRPFEGEIAHERLVVGPSFDQPLVLSENADYFSFLRLGLDTRVVQYQFVHGALGDRASNPLDTAFVLVAPERFLALHRLTVQPHRRFSVALTEMVVYGQRGPELAAKTVVFTDLGLSPATSYRYRVKAKSPSGGLLSAPSNEASATTAAVPVPVWKLAYGGTPDTDLVTNEGGFANHCMVQRISAARA